jgi:hypothetical protein
MAMRRLQRGIWLMGPVALLVGCNLLTPLVLFAPDPKKKVPAEFDWLSGKRVLVLVWAPQETLIEYPWARLEVAQYVGDGIAAHVKDMKTVPPKEVEDYLQRIYEIEYDPAAMGKKFEAEAVVYLELLEYEMRNPDAPQLRRGTIRSSVMVYDMTSPKEPEKFELQEITVRVPEGNDVGVMNKTGLQIRKMTYEKFADCVAKKFYEHEETL